MAGIPFDVIREILLFVTMKDHLRFRCVSNFFRSLIDSQDFIKLHASYSEKSNSDIYGIFEHVRFEQYPFFVNLRDRSAIEIPFAVVDLDRSAIDIPDVVVHPPHCRPKTGLIQGQVVGSSHGFVALQNHNFENEFVFWNPFTGQSRILTSTITTKKPNRIIACGFGYDPETDDYKLVSNTICPETAVYSLKANSWKKITPGWSHYWFKYKLRENVGVLVNNALHWLIRDENDNTKIVAFNLVTEEFYFVPIMGSLYVYFRSGVKLSVLDKCLTVTIDGSTNARFDNYVWVMKKYGVRNSWAKILTYRTSIPPALLSDSYLITPLTYSRGRDKVLLSNIDTLFWYDLASEKTESCLIVKKKILLKTFTGSRVVLDELIDTVS